jgi:hypothetical protein
MRSRNRILQNPCRQKRGRNPASAMRGCTNFMRSPHEDGPAVMRIRTIAVQKQPVSAVGALWLH